MFLGAGDWNQLRCLSLERRENKMWWVHAVEYDAWVRGTGLDVHSTVRNRTNHNIDGKKSNNRIGAIALYHVCKYKRYIVSTKSVYSTRVHTCK